MITLVVIPDIVDEDSWQTYVSYTDVCQLLAEHVAVMPEGAKLYHESIDDEHDVTPHNEGGIDYLQDLQGTFWLVIFPHDPISKGTSQRIA